MADPLVTVSFMPASDTPSVAALLVGTHDVAKMIDVARSTFQKWCAKGPGSGLIPTPVYRIGGQLKWKPADVLSWIEAQQEMA